MMYITHSTALLLVLLFVVLRADTNLNIAFTSAIPAAGNQIISIDSGAGTTARVTTQNGITTMYTLNRRGTLRRLQFDQRNGAGTVLGLPENTDPWDWELMLKEGQEFEDTVFRFVRDLRNDQILMVAVDTVYFLKLDNQGTAKVEIVVNNASLTDSGKADGLTMFDALAVTGTPRDASVGIDPIGVFEAVLFAADNNFVLLEQQQTQTTNGQGETTTTYSWDIVGSAAHPSLVGAKDIHLDKDLIWVVGKTPVDPQTQQGGDISIAVYKIQGTNQNRQVGLLGQWEQSDIEGCINSESEVSCSVALAHPQTIRTHTDGSTLYIGSSEGAFVAGEQQRGFVAALTIVLSERNKLNTPVGLKWKSSVVLPHAVTRMRIPEQQRFMVVSGHDAVSLLQVPVAASDEVTLGLVDTVTNGDRNLVAKVVDMQNIQDIWVYSRILDENTFKVFTAAEATLELVIAVCGDGNFQTAAEECETNDQLDGRTCASFDRVGGNLACNPKNCEFDLSHCGPEEEPTSSTAPVPVTDDDSATVNTCSPVQLQKVLNCVADKEQERRDDGEEADKCESLRIAAVCYKENECLDSYKDECESEATKENCEEGTCNAASRLTFSVMLAALSVIWSLF
eukprot:TRINITY_DN65930_c10_g2_i1.p1 TRINITY_DN65930_c10_g2~~TRINITY_DN65930_c10_g2_i1.p1  ORF type:complete len:623 (-),score=87.34 TRINITY_DN65930_c10_g2_i1:420-2288(-)